MLSRRAGFGLIGLAALILACEAPPPPSPEVREQPPHMVGSARLKRASRATVEERGFLNRRYEISVDGDVVARIENEGVSLTLVTDDDPQRTVCTSERVLPEQFRSYCCTTGGTVTHLGVERYKGWNATEFRVTAYDARYGQLTSSGRFDRVRLLSHGSCGDASTTEHFSYARISATSFEVTWKEGSPVPIEIPLILGYLEQRIIAQKLSTTKTEDALEVAAEFAAALADALSE